MRNIICLLYVFMALVSCTQEDEFNLLVSQSELIFTPDGGEQIVNVTSDVDWNCEYSADWILVRQQQDLIRVIVDENPSKDLRSEIVKITVNGAVQHEIVVTQEGTSISAETQSISVASMGETMTLPIQVNADWSVENTIGWCTVNKSGDNIEIAVERNYQMKERNGVFVLHSGDLSLEICVNQSGCEWFESFEMIDVEAGVFYMGAQTVNSENPNYDASAYQIESPVHFVSLNSYSIGRYEVTQAQWLAAMGENPSNTQGDNLPVENVTWEQVQEFIAVLNEKSGLNYRLPTEAEWEFAAKGGNFSGEFKYSGNSVLGVCGWYYSNSEASTHEIGSKSPNELGIFDMSGNVREWCNDWFGYYSSSEENNPQGADTGTMKVNRGGSWSTPAVNCRNSYRHTDFPNECAHDLGFRLALTQ